MRVRLVSCGSRWFCFLAVLLPLVLVHCDDDRADTHDDEGTDTNGQADAVEDTEADVTEADVTEDPAVPGEPVNVHVVGLGPTSGATVIVHDSDGLVQHCGETAENGVVTLPVESGGIVTLLRPIQGGGNTIQSIAGVEPGDEITLIGSSTALYSLIFQFPDEDFPDGTSVVFLAGGGCFGGCYATPGGDCRSGVAIYFSPICAGAGHLDSLPVVAIAVDDQGLALGHLASEVRLSDIEEGDTSASVDLTGLTWQTTTTSVEIEAIGETSPGSEISASVDVFASDVRMRLSLDNLNIPVPQEVPQSFVFPAEFGQDLGLSMTIRANDFTSLQSNWRFVGKPDRITIDVGEDFLGPLAIQVADPDSARPTLTWTLGEGPDFEPVVARAHFQWLEGPVSSWEILFPYDSEGTSGASFRLPALDGCAANTRVQVVGDVVGSSLAACDITPASTYDAFKAVAGLEAFSGGVETRVRCTQSNWFPD